MPKQVKKKQKKKRSPRFWRRLFGILIALAALGIAAALSLTVLFPVHRCTTDGETRYTINDFSSALGIGTEKMNLFTADKAALARKVHTKLPYVQIVFISRRLPGTLKLTVVDLKPAFAQEQDKVWWLLSERGKLLGTAKSLPKGLMPILGEPLQSPVAGQQARWKNAFTKPADISALLSCLKDSKLWSSVTAVQISTAALPDIVYQDRIRIRLGTASPSNNTTPEAVLQEKMRMAAEVIAEKDKQNPKQRGTLDLSTYGKAYFTADWS